MEKFEINAVEMTRQIRDKHYEQTKNMSRAERLAFYREQARLMNIKAEQILKAKREREHA
ncbi:MAG: hypothetical protein HZC40_19540 [Chloroflexi bacterium]|nr:hypothetical protein [Chloroflexota bacterium]